MNNTAQINAEIEQLKELLNTTNAMRNNVISGDWRYSGTNFMVGPMNDIISGIETQIKKLKSDKDYRR